jgi:hypothetical protein
MTQKSTRGGLRNPPGGRPKKPPEEKRQRRLITLPPDIAAKLDKVENASELITQLLAQYFERIEQ